MKKRSHILIGRYLNELQAFEKRRHEKAFLFGCVEPDYNYLTYLKGALTVGFTRGHNFKKAQQNLRKTIVKLQKNRCLPILKYYRLGKLMHYVADAFTSPHNDVFSAADHIDYEKRLHIQLIMDIADPFGIFQSRVGGSLIEYFAKKHQEYLDAWQSPHTDVQFILEATAVVFRQLMPKTAVAAEV